MRIATVLCTSFVIAATTTLARADDLLVPRQFATIEAAEATAQAGDRIVVKGGTHANVEIRRGGVSIVGRGATLAGYVFIDGSDVTLQGFRMKSGAVVVVTGTGVRVTGNRPAGNAAYGVWVHDGARAVIDGNRMRGGVLQVTGAADAAIRSNRAPKAALRLGGSGALAESNVVATVEVGGTGVVVRGNRCDTISGASDACVVAGNRVAAGIDLSGDSVTATGNQLGSGVQVIGDDAVISGNRVAQGTFGVAVTGNRPTITGNVMNVGSMIVRLDPAIGDVYRTECPGVVVVSDEPGGVVSDNDITHTRGTGIVLATDGATVEGNTVHGVSSSTSLAVNGSGNTVADNTIFQTGSELQGGAGVAISGDANSVESNRITGTATEGIIVLAGTGNELTLNVMDRTHGCGVLLTADATDTVVAGCTVKGCDLGLVNLGTDTSATGSTFTGNKWADVLDLTGFESFLSNQFGSLSHDAFLAPQR
jgi:nitrous oxidase accessory protein NosD